MTSIIDLGCQSRVKTAVGVIPRQMTLRIAVGGIKTTANQQLSVRHLLNFSDACGNVVLDHQVRDRSQSVVERSVRVQPEDSDIE